MPSHPPERGQADGHDWDLQKLKWADDYGFEARPAPSKTPAPFPIPAPGHRAAA
jgi:hypothetical protein